MLLLLLLLLLLLKTTPQAQVEKTTFFIRCFRNPTSTCVTVNWRKHNSGKQPTVDCIPEPIQRSGIKHSVGKVIPHSNLRRQGTCYKLGRATPWYFKLQCLKLQTNTSNWHRRTILKDWENITQGLGEQMQNSNEVTQRYPQIYFSPTSKYRFSEVHWKQYHAHGL